MTLVNFYHFTTWLRLTARTLDWTIYDFMADLTGTGDRSSYDICET